MAFRGWLSIHHGMALAGLLVGVAMCGLAAKPHMTSRLIVELGAPVATGMFVPAAAGVCVAIGCAEVRLPQLETTKVRLARVPWVLALTVIALIAAATVVGGAARAGSVTPIELGAVVRGVLVSAALAVATVRFASASLAWLPTTLVTAFAAQFGTDGITYSWWGLTLAPAAGPVSIAVSAVMFTFALLAYAIQPRGG